MKRTLSILCALLLLLTACGPGHHEQTDSPVHQEPAHHPAGAEPDSYPDSTEPAHHPGRGEHHTPAPGEPAAPEPPASREPPAIPEKVANASAGLIRERVWRGDSAGTWLPLLADVTWEELAASQDDFDCVWEACNDIFVYVQEQGQRLTEEEYRVLLTHVQGLDGAYAEGYAGVLYDLYVLNPTRFASMALDRLPPDQREAALVGLLYNWAYCHGLEEDMDRVRHLEILTARLEEDKKGKVNASPDVMRFDYEGQSARLLPVNVSGIYAASYVSDRPETASVDAQTGLVTAVGPGEAVITLHLEGGGLNQDFTCAVVCAWQKKAA